jgi:hypothetical protein
MFPGGWEGELHGQTYPAREKPRHHRTAHQQAGEPTRQLHIDITSNPDRQAIDIRGATSAHSLDELIALD